MEKHPVSSSTGISIGYDAPTQTLEIEFRSGRVYQYYEVPDHMHTEIMQASSKGKFFNTYIKSAYPFSRVGLVLPAAVHSIGRRNAPVTLGYAKTKNPQEWLEPQ